MSRTSCISKNLIVAGLCAVQLCCTAISVTAQTTLKSPSMSNPQVLPPKIKEPNAPKKIQATKEVDTVPEPKDKSTVRELDVVEVPMSTMISDPFPPVAGTTNRCNYSLCNLPTQPQVAPGRCQPCTVAIDCADNCGGGIQSWKNLHPYPFGPLAHGEYLGPIRLPATLDYRLRVGDQLGFIFIDSPTQLFDTYRLMVGDELTIESNTDEKVRGNVTVLPDGMIFARLIGPVRSEGLTIPQLRNKLEKAYKDYIKEPSIDITPVKWNSLKTAVLNSVDARAGTGGQNYTDLVHPDGTVRLPKIGAVCVLGMTLDEVKREVNLRLHQAVPGLEVEPRILAEAQHTIFITGEVTNPNRYTLVGPTTVTQAIAMAGGTKLGSNLREIVIFRRAEDWRLIATRIDLRGAHLGKVGNPADEIFLRDSDLIIVPQTPIKLFNNFVKQVFTDGVYGVVPFGGISITRFQGGSFNAN
jgi:polysaccharide biosynthesis/export protein